MKFAGFAAFSLALIAATSAQAAGPQKIGAQSLVTKSAAMRGPQKIVVTKPVTKIVYRTIVREVPVAPQPILVREPVTQWMPSILPPFSYPVTTYQDRIVYSTPTYTQAPAYQTATPAYRVIDDEDASPVVRAYAPGAYVVRY